MTKPDLKDPEVRAQFFAQYWGQEVLKYRYGAFQLKISKANICDSDCCLSLRPVESLTEEEMKELILFVTRRTICDRPEWIRDSIIEYSYSHKVTENETMLGSGVLNVKHGVTSKALDWLRSRGFATEWRGISVEEQIAAGVVVLRKDGE